MCITAIMCNSHKALQAYSSALQTILPRWRLTGSRTLSNERTQLEPLLAAASNQNLQSAIDALTFSQVDSRWYAAQQQGGSPSVSALHISEDNGRSTVVGPNSKCPTGASTTMFCNEHLSQLEPIGWRQHTLGKGAFATVFQARWQGVDVAVKELHRIDSAPVQKFRSGTAG